MAIEITRENAIEMFRALGITTADKWNKKRMKAKLAAVSEMVDEDTNLDGPADETLTTVLEAIEKGEDIEVTNAEDVPEPKGKKKGSENKDKKGKKKGSENKDKKGKKKGSENKDKKGGEKNDGIRPKGVRASNTRPYLAGRIVAKYGLDTGVTDEMVQELNDLYGRANDVESLGRIKNAWHSIRGYLGYENDQ